MTLEKEFKVNDYILLKLENGKTNIYIKGTLFNQSKFLMLTNPIFYTEELKEVESIDEVAKKLGWYNGGQFDVHYEIQEISPDDEFWGHCSNLQAWWEHSYDTRILHSSLAFHLLKKLTDAGDPLAKQVFKEELLNRLKTGDPNVVDYLIEEGFYNLLNKNELRNIVNPSEALALEEIERFTGIKLSQIGGLGCFADIESRKHGSFVIKNGTVVEMDLKWEDKTSFLLPDSVVNLKNLRVLWLDLYRDPETELSEFPELIILPGQIFKLKSLKELYIFSYRLALISDSLKNLRFLKVLDIYVEHFAELVIPSSIGKLLNLRDLRISDLKSVPESIGKLSKLTRLTLCGMFETIPRSICNLSKLEYLNLNTTNIIIPKSVANLISLKELWIRALRILNPENLTGLRSLKELNIFSKLVNEQIKSWLKLKKMSVISTIGDINHYKTTPICSWCKSFTNIGTGEGICQKYKKKIKNTSETCSFFFPIYGA